MRLLGLCCGGDRRRTPFISGYVREGLVAEIGAAFVCADLGLRPEERKDHAPYVGHWLKEDKRAIFAAAALAQRASDHLHELQTPPGA